MANNLSEGTLSRPASTRWIWLSLIPLGLGAWAPIYGGVRARRTSWWALGICWSLITISGWAISVASNGDAASGGALIVIGWIGAIATSFTVRTAYAREMGSDFQAAVTSAEERMAEQDRARRLAKERPRIAREVGIGRPDLPNTHHAGLIDMNNAPAAALMELPGVNETLATRITEARAVTNGFSSVEDLGAALDLEGKLVEDLRDRVVFLPR